MKVWGTALFLMAAAMGFHHRPLTDNEIRHSVVQLASDTGFCTGEQVQGRSGKLYILTAGHCVGLGHKLFATTEDGRRQQLRFVAESRYADLALYTPMKGVAPFDLGKSRRHDNVRIFSHGLHHATYTAQGEALEQILEDIELPEMPSDGCTAPKYKAGLSIWSSCSLHTLNVVTTAWAVPGSSGGPAVDAYGNLIGVVSGGNDRFTYLVPYWAVAKFLKRF